LGSLGLFALYIQKHRGFVLLGLGAFVPLAATMILSLFIYTANRYVFVSLVSWLILASFGIVELIKKTQGGYKILAAGTLVILMLSAMSDNLMYFMIQHGNRADWKSAVNLVEENMRPGDRIYSSSPAVLNYYTGERTINIKRFKPAKEEELNKRAWFIIDNIAESYYAKNSNWVKQNTRLMDSYDVTVMARNFKMRVYFYDPVAANEQQ
jgi:hypothetical protein